MIGNTNLPMEGTTDLVLSVSKFTKPYLLIYVLTYIHTYLFFQER